MANQQHQLSSEDIQKLRADGQKLQHDAQRSLDKLQQKENRAQANGQELSTFDKVLRGLSSFAKAVGRSAERMANDAARKNRNNF